MPSPYLYYQTMANNQANGSNSSEIPNLYGQQFYHYQQQPRLSNPGVAQPNYYMMGYNAPTASNFSSIPPPPSNSVRYWGPAHITSTVPSNASQTNLSYLTHNGPQVFPPAVPQNNNPVNSQKEANCLAASSNTQNSESSLSSSPEHSASEASPAGSGVEGGESESAESDAVSGNTARSEHTKTGLGAGSASFQPVSNFYSVKTSGSSSFGMRPAAPGAHSYPTPVSLIKIKFSIVDVLFYTRFWPVMCLWQFGTSRSFYQSGNASLLQFTFLFVWPLMTRIIHLQLIRLS